MDGSHIAGIAQWLHDPKAAETLRSPLSVVDSLEKLSLEAFTNLKKLPAYAVTDPGELAQTLSDIEAFAHIGMYYAHKIRAAYQLASYDKNGKNDDQQRSLSSLKKAEESWNRYAAIYSAKNAPALYNRVYSHGSGLLKFQKFLQPIYVGIGDGRKIGDAQRCIFPATIAFSQNNPVCQCFFPQGRHE